MKQPDSPPSKQSKSFNIPVNIGIAVGAVAAAVLAYMMAIIRRPPKPQATHMIWSDNPGVPDLLAQTETGSASTAGNILAIQAAPPGASRSAMKASVVASPAPEPKSRTKQDTRWTATSRYIGGVFLVLAVFGVLVFIGGNLWMLLLSGVVALITRPLVRFLVNRWHMKHNSAVMLTYLLVVLVLILIPLVVLPLLINSVNEMLTTNWEQVAQSFSDRLSNFEESIATVPVIRGLLTPTVDALVKMLNGVSMQIPASEQVTYQVTLQNSLERLGSMLGLLFNILGPVVSGIVSLVFMLLISLHMSLTARSFTPALLSQAPKHYRPELRKLLHKLSEIWTSFLTGQFTLMVVVGVLVFFFNWLVGTPFPLLLGLISGLLEVIPSLGPALALIPASIIALTMGSTRLDVDPFVFMLIVIAGYSLIQVLENQVLVPYILGDAVDLPPLVVLIGVTVFGSAAGILGIFLATPIISSSKLLFQYVFDKVTEPPPPLVPPEPKPSLFERLRGLTSKLRRSKSTE
jgi:predicted PurR-regulated permease PerM